MIARTAIIAAVATLVGLGHGLLRPVRLGLEPTPRAASAPAGEFTGRGAPFLTLAATRRRFEAQAAFVDARAEDEFASGHIRGAVRLEPASFSLGYPEGLDDVPRNTDVVVYCGNADCDAAILVAKRLGELGYTPVFVFEHGLEAWRKAGYETVRER